MDYHFKRLSAYGVEVFENVPGEELVSFKSGGKVRRLMRPSSTEGLAECVYTLALLGEEYCVLGNGTNVLISDAGYEGTVISLRRMKFLKVDDNFLYASSGMSLPTLSLIARDNSLTGLEFAIGIPASLGGAVTMNAGAYNSQIGDKVAEVEVLNGSTVENWRGNELEFGYRESVFSGGNCIVLGAKLNLDYGDADEIRELIREYTKRRAETQPQEPSAGSVFKKVLGRSAGYYIEQLGLKGKRIGGAEISTVHANFIVNKGGATTTDYLSLAAYAAEETMNNYGIELETEVKLIGE
jgi:UDP-N-acetylenolpyruvoylglucosamine reductase